MAVAAGACWWRAPGSPPCCCSPARRRSRCPRWSAPIRPTPRPSCARTASSVDTTLKTADQPDGPGHRAGPDGRDQGQEGLDGDADRLRRPPAGRGAAGGRPDRLLGTRAIGQGRPEAVRARGELRHGGEGQGDLGQPDRGHEGRQGLVGHARRLQRQDAGRRARRHRQELRRGAVDPAGGRVQGDAHGQGDDRRRTRTSCSRRTPRAAPRSTRARPSRSRWPRRPARSRSPT